MKGKKSCKYFDTCGSGDNCKDCKGYKKAVDHYLDKYGLIPLGTKTKYGVITGLHTKNGERSYFIHGKVVSLIPHDILVLDLKGKAI